MKTRSTQAPETDTETCSTCSANQNRDCPKQEITASLRFGTKIYFIKRLPNFKISFGMSNKRVFEIFCYLPKALKKSELHSETNFTLYNLLLSLNHESKQAYSIPCYSKNLRFQVSDFLLLTFIKPIPPLD